MSSHQHNQATRALADEKAREERLNANIKRLEFLEKITTPLALLCAFCWMLIIIASIKLWSLS